MNNKCLHLKLRTKKGQRYFYCSRKRAVIEITDCYGCINKEYKKVAKSTLKTSSRLIAKKPINKVSKKRVTVSKKTYEEVFNRCNGVCAICGTYQNLHLHHIDGRGKDKTDNPNNCIMLCSYCHLEVVHKNNKYWRKKLKELI